MTRCLPLKLYFFKTTYASPVKNSNGVKKWRLFDLHINFLGSDSVTIIKRRYEAKIITPAVVYCLNNFMVSSISIECATRENVLLSVQNLVRHKLQFLVLFIRNYHYGSTACQSEISRRASDGQLHCS